MITRRSSRRLESAAAAAAVATAKDEELQTSPKSGAGTSSEEKKRVEKKTKAKKIPNKPKVPSTVPQPVKTTINKQQSLKRKSKEVESNEFEIQPTDQLEQQQPNKKVKNNKIDFNSEEVEPVIEHLKILSGKNIYPDQHVNIESEIVDQIALEGLSGITMSKLFRILDAIFPNLNCTQDENSAKFVWSILLNRYLRYPHGSNVQVCYIDPTLAQNTDETAILDGRNISKDKPIPLPKQTLKRFVSSDTSLYPVQEGYIMGSCKNYLTRMDITSEVLNLLDKDVSLNSMRELDTKYGLNNLVFVACQALRTKAILPNWADPNIDLKLREYCALELIGRSRTLGIVFPHDKTLGRYRIMLLAKGFITQYQESSSSPIEHHLIRFRYKRLTPKSGNLTSKFNREAASSSDDDEGHSEGTLSSYCLDPNKLKVDRSMLSMVYDVIAESNGLIQLEIRRKLKLPKFHLRNHLKNLISIEMIYSKTSKSDPEKAGFRIFKTAHKSAKRKKIRDELAKPTGIMASWDEPDLRAKKIIGHKRSSFSKAEDSLLILCRITSILIEPNLKLSWCVHKRLVRDLLHKELVESHDKTSDACLRRIKYLKRLPNNIMSINELTAELRDDPEIRRFIPEKSQCNEDKLNKAFVQVLKLVRSKIPNLLGITSSATTTAVCKSSQSGKKISNQVIDGKNKVVIDRTSEDKDEARDEENYFEIKDHNNLKEKYELIECQPVASISRAATYEKPKNVVDIRFNNASLVTMAFYLTSCFQSKGSECATNKRQSHWLMDKFYSNYHDKLVSSMLSKLNKRSLLTRKCSAADHASLYKPKNRMSLKLNQSVLFLLNRHQSHSLIQLAHAISPTYKINLSENNEMFSIALLTSLCSSSLFNLDMELKIPPNVVGIDQGNENFRSLLERASEGTREILSRFMGRCGGSLAASVKSSTEAAKLDSATNHHRQKGFGAGEGAFEIVEASVSSPPSAPSASSVPDTQIAGPSAKSSSDDDHKGKPAENPATPEITSQTASSNKMDDSRRALFLLRHELKAHALDKCGSLADCLIVQPCNIKFSSDQHLELKKESLDEFLNQAKPLDLIDAAAAAGDTQQQQHANWLVKSFRLPDDDDVDHEHDNLNNSGERDLDALKVRIEYQARLWKTIDGRAHAPTLFKLIESLLSWIIVFPGVELETLQSEFNHLMPDEHIIELLELMENLELISSTKMQVPSRRPRLFGYVQLDGVQLPPVITYETSANAYVSYCQLLNYCE